MILSLMTFRKMTVSIMTHNIVSLFTKLSINDILHVPLSIIGLVETLSIMILSKMTVGTRHDETQCNRLIYDTQHNNPQHNDIHHNDNQYNGPICNTLHQ
jgi:hypothetical protein